MAHAMRLLTDHIEAMLWVGATIQQSEGVTEDEMMMVVA